MVQSLERAGAEVDAIRSVSAIDSEKIGHRYIFIDVGDCDRTDLDFVLERSSQRTHIALLVNDAPLGEFTALLADPRINHIISERELENGIFITAQKLLSGAICLRARRFTIFGSMTLPGGARRSRPSRTLRPNPGSGSACARALGRSAKSC
jgi:hypothetical protein